MPPAPSKKAAAAAKPPRTERRSVSRHSTPVSALTDSTAPATPLTTATPTVPQAAGPSHSSGSTSSTVPRETAYLRTSTAGLLNNDASIGQLIAGTSARNSEPPTAKELTKLHDKLRDTITKSMGKRGEICDRSMRELAQRRKKRVQMEREREENAAEERRKVKKRSHDEMELDERKAAAAAAAAAAEAEADEEERTKRRGSLPSVGAHGLARQDGVGVHEGQPPPPSPPIPPGTATIDPMDAADSPSDSDDGLADPPSTVPLYERAFGKDPTQSDDHTIYEIRPVTADMTDDEKRQIYNVAHWPTVDLTEYTAGEPPDADFSNAKPANQVNFSTFQSYVEPYIRLFTEEDVAFLKERGDRVQPFLIPEFGRKGYKEIWAIEDGLTGLEPPTKVESNPNEPRGSMADMDDATAETDEVSAGPVMERLLSLIRRAPNAKKEDPGADAEGDTSMANADDPDPHPGAGAGAPDEPNHRPPTTALPPDAPRIPNLPALDYGTMDQRLLQELRYIGFLDPAETPNYASHADDEVCARLRTLQHELRRVSHHNNVRKARVLELTEERMAMQEYSNIADDLDNQVNAAYLKRNRSLAAKPSKKGAAARAAQKGVAASVGGAGGGRGVSDGVRALMQKRRDWIDMVGPVVKYGRGDILGDEQTIFDDAGLARWERAEREAEGGEGDAE